MSNSFPHPFNNYPTSAVRGGNNYVNSLPPQAIPKSKKNSKWKRATLDRFEIIGVNQINKNKVFDEYYKMVGGSVSFHDFSELPEFLREVRDVRAEVDLPTTIKHYDILGLIVNTIVGEYLNLSTKYKVTASDEVTMNEMLREKTRRIDEYASQVWSAELELILMEQGINPKEAKFKSEEEQQAYIQQVEQIKRDNTPRQIELDLRKNFKTRAVEWAERKLELDYELFKMNEFDMLESTSYMLTGRWFREYKLNYDSYEPRHWKSRETFISEEEDLKYPQKGEYIGRVRLMTPSQIINEYGTKLTPVQIQRLTGYYDEEISESNGSHTNIGTKSFDTLSKTWFGEDYITPLENYHQYQFGKELETLSGIPMGNRVVGDKEVPSWIPTLLTNFKTDRIISNGRIDIDVRQDVIQVTEAYWKSPERVGLLTYLNEEGLITQDIVTDDLLPEFLEAYGIKKVNTISLEDAQGKPQINTIVYTYIPQVRWGCKINKANSYLEDDVYLGGDILPYQVKGGVSNVYDIQLPVAGIVDVAPIRKALPYQRDYNVLLNQIYMMLEKEIGLFFLLDFNYLPSEFKDMPSTEEILVNVKAMAKDLGLLPADFSKQNTAGGSNINSMVAQDMSYTNHIIGKLNIANQYKMLALEQVGINPQRMGTPQKYDTAEGLKMGQQAVFNQTSNIFNILENARLSALDIHLAIAQYCEKNTKSITLFGTQSDSDVYLMQFVDENFHLRQLGAYPTSDSKKAKELESVKAQIIANNTLGGDILGFAAIATSDTMSGLMNVARDAYRRQQEELQAKREHEQSLLDKQLEAQAQKDKDDRDFMEASKEKDRRTDIAIAAIQANAKATDANASIAELDFMNKNLDRIAEANIKQSGIDLEQQKIDLMKDKQAQEKTTKIDETNLRLLELEEKRKAREAQERISIRNKN